MSPVDLITPDDADFAVIAEKIYAAREDLQAAFGSRDNPEYRRWLASSGVLEHGEHLARFYPPTPPEELRKLGCGGHLAQPYLYSSVCDFEAVLETWQTFAGNGVPALGSAYDFGCGSGRAMRWFSRILPADKCFGSDVGEGGIEWCQENLPGTYVTNAAQPPLPFEDDSFDFVFSLSVFTHLNEQSGAAWLAELARVCKPDGCLVLSVLGMFGLSAIAAREELQQLFEMKPDDARGIMRRLDHEGCVFQQQSQDILEQLPGVEQVYGSTFMAEPYIRHQWGRRLEILGILPARLHMLQDFVVARPR